MRVWIDLANSPHVATFEPVVAALRARGDEVVLTAREHAQTVPLARTAFPELPLEVVGGESPPGRLAKGRAVAERARGLARVARRDRPHVALSHGSYAQLLAARRRRIPGVTMMDYEFQPANHVSFRLARRVVVPELFPGDALRRFGARARKVIRYAGFKEELYLGSFRPDAAVLDELGVDPAAVLAVFRPPPEGALYHRMGNARFDEVLELAAARDGVAVVLLPRGGEQARRYAGQTGVVVPARPVDGRSLLAHADLMIGAGGTMNREAALLGTPTYTLFAGRRPAVDSELIRLGLLHELVADDAPPALTKKPQRDASVAAARAEAILGRVLGALDTLA